MLGNEAFGEQVELPLGCKATADKAERPRKDEAVMKLFYLALQNISKKWTMPLRDWKPALNRFTIQFDERMPQQ